MHKVFTAALELQELLRESGRPFCFIGGLALQCWGNPRQTQDADATVVTAFEHDEEIITKCFARFESRRPDGVSFARQNRVVLLQATNGIGLDVSLGAFDFELKAANRAVEWDFAEGQTLRICTAHDLVVFKAFAARDQDWADIRNIVLRQGTKLNPSHILQDLAPLVALKEDESIIPKLRLLLKQTGS